MLGAPIAPAVEEDVGLDGESGGDITALADKGADRTAEVSEFLDGILGPCLSGYHPHIQHLGCAYSSE